MAFWKLSGRYHSRAPIFKAGQRTNFDLIESYPVERCPSWQGIDWLLEPSLCPPSPDHGATTGVVALLLYDLTVAGATEYSGRVAR